MKKAVEIILIALFLLQGAKNMSAIVAVLLLLLFTTIFLKKANKIRVPAYYLVAVVLYIFYLVLGFYNGHPEAQIDIKFQIFAFILYFWFLNNWFKIDYLGLLFTLNVITFFIFILIFLGLLPTLWNSSSFGLKGRVYGPALIPIILIAFYYLFYQKQFDLKLIKASILALIYISLASSFMNLGIAACLLIIVTMNIKKLFTPKYLIVAFILIGLSIAYLYSPWVPEMIASKMEYVLRPWEYGSIQTRIQDLRQAIQNENFGWFKIIFGEGFGASSTIYRENKYATSLSAYFSFLEIDNGFYYIYHRGGLSLLGVFIISHLYLIWKCPNFKTRVGFIILFLITNLLSIQYFTYLFYLYIPFIILEQKRIRFKEDFKEKIA